MSGPRDQKITKENVVVTHKPITNQDNITKAHNEIARKIGEILLLRGVIKSGADIGLISYKLLEDGDLGGDIKAEKQGLLIAPSSEKINSQDLNLFIAQNEKWKPVYKKYSQGPKKIMEDVAIAKVAQGTPISGNRSSYEGIGGEKYGFGEHRKVPIFLFEDESGFDEKKAREAGTNVLIVKKEPNRRQKNIFKIYQYDRETGRKLKESITFSEEKHNVGYSFFYQLSQKPRDEKERGIEVEPPKEILDNLPKINFACSEPKLAAEREKLILLYRYRDIGESHFKVNDSGVRQRPACQECCGRFNSDLFREEKKSGTSQEKKGKDTDEDKKIENEKDSTILAKGRSASPGRLISLNPSDSKRPLPKKPFSFTSQHSSILDKIRRKTEVKEEEIKKYISSENKEEQIFGLTLKALSLHDAETMPNEEAMKYWLKAKRLGLDENHPLYNKDGLNNEEKNFLKKLSLEWYKHQGDDYYARINEEGVPYDGAILCYTAAIKQAEELRDQKQLEEPEKILADLYLKRGLATQKSLSTIFSQESNHVEYAHSAIRDYEKSIKLNSELKLSSQDRITLIDAAICGLRKGESLSTKTKEIEKIAGNDPTAAYYSSNRCVKIHPDNYSKILSKGLLAERKISDENKTVLSNLLGNLDEKEGHSSILAKALIKNIKTLKEEKLQRKLSADEWSGIEKHLMEIFPPAKCDILSMPFAPDQKKLNELPIKSKAAYVRAKNKLGVDTLYYVNKETNKSTEITRLITELKEFDKIVNPTPVAKTLTITQLEAIAQIKTIKKETPQSTFLQELQKAIVNEKKSIDSPAPDQGSTHTSSARSPSRSSHNPDDSSSSNSPATDLLLPKKKFMALLKEEKLNTNELDITWNKIIVEDRKLTKKYVFGKVGKDTEIAINFINELSNELKKPLPKQKEYLMGKFTGVWNNLKSQFKNKPKDEKEAIEQLNYINDRITAIGKNKKMLDPNKEKIMYLKEKFLAIKEQFPESQDINSIQLKAAAGPQDLYSPDDEPPPDAPTVLTSNESTVLLEEKFSVYESNEKPPQTEVTSSSVQLAKKREIEHTTEPAISIPLPPNSPPTKEKPKGNIMGSILSFFTPKKGADANEERSISEISTSPKRWRK